MMSSLVPPPAVWVLLAKLLHEKPVSKHWKVIVPIAVALYWFPPHTIIGIWQPVAWICAEWHRLSIFKGTPSLVVDGGPLGAGCYKLVEVVTGLVLWTLAYGWRGVDGIHGADNEGDDTTTLPPPLRFGHLPSYPVLGLLLVFAAGTNGVLWLWSRYEDSRGTHEGVNDMVQSSMGRTLTTTEHLKLAIFALANAFCEEADYRGILMTELCQRGELSLHHANIAQALCFGIGHYSGIPSGWTGVGLTFVYGFLQGMLANHCDGLFLAVMTHTVADYFIFSVIARRKEAHKES